MGGMLDGDFGEAIGRVMDVVMERVVGGVMGAGRGRVIDAGRERVMG